MNEINAIAEPGLMLTASLLKAGVVLHEDIPMVESGVFGFYTGSAPAGLIPGTYTVLVFSGDQMVATGSLSWDGDREIDAAYLMHELHLVHGLRAGVPLQVSPFARVAGVVNQSITTDGSTTTVARS